VRRLIALLALGLGGCSSCGSPDAGPDALPPDADVISPEDCGSDTASWVRNAYLAIVGHRPHGQAEVDLYTALHDRIAELREAGDTDADPKEVVARAMTEEEAFQGRWTSHFLDALRVPRIEDQAMAGCYGDGFGRGGSPALATYVRDNLASAGGSGGQFTMRDLVESSILLDDVTPIYRGHLFALVSYPIPAANVPPVEAELARREDFGLVFDSAYLNRDLVCLQCHNSEISVTDHSEPALDRHWPLEGRFEEALYGDRSGIAHARAHAVFRFDGFAASWFGEGPRKPWGWTTPCGSFYTNPGDDPAAIDGKFGDLTGRRLTVYDLEASLRDGFEALRGGALVRGEDGSIADPDHAFAYLVAATIVEGVWKEVIGSGLTIANYFPRNQAARDLLAQLTDRFIASGYSLEDLLVGIVSNPYFSPAMPEEGCGETPYFYPNVYDPWVISDDDEARRQNGAGDAVAPVSARTLLRSVFAALDWEVPAGLDFPTGDGGFCSGFECDDLEEFCDQGFCCETYEAQCLGGGGGEVDELAFQQGTGAFLKNGERGFRGLDFQARLHWEDRFGRCNNPGSSDDFVDVVVAAASADGAATARDVVVALKDRLIGEPAVDDPAERAALEALLGGGLDTPAAEVPELAARVRQLCGVLLSSPQFLLSGAAGQGGAVPRLTPAAWQFDAVCGRVAGRITAVDVSCGADDVTVTAP
jgi:hypothetical protein